MLQRAASNAYSWWWASHIRTKQSKWLDNSLQGQSVLLFVRCFCSCVCLLIFFLFVGFLRFI
ncbi:hypothetical protein B296_00031197 [Ensete ventricosum]|uniref:NAB domain-containing protein n=1 Tax=Ensete ventricosum TaxID=4639 RepID=A0A426XWS5_ENSVE|nr:hypothetical protein B296_00031197 [Ensete ventricosum]